MLRSISNIDKSRLFGEIFVYDEIADDKINGQLFANEMQYLVDIEQIPEVRVRINSVGGSVVHAMSIFSVIRNVNETGRAVVNTYNDGLAASSAGFILLAGENVYSADYARLMIHGVSTSKNDLSDNDRETLKQFEGMITDVFVARTGKDASFFTDLLTNGRDNWFTTPEAVIAGLYKTENIENTGLTMDLPENLSRVALAVQNRAQKIINDNKNPIKMKKVTALLSLQEGANEEAISLAVSNALNAAQTAGESLTAIQNKLTERDAELLEVKNKLATALDGESLSVVENAVKEGKLNPKNAAEKTVLVDQCKGDIAGFKNLLSFMPTVANKIAAHIDNSKEDASGLMAKIENKTFRELERTGAAILKEVKNSLPEQYAKLYNEQYGTTKTAAELS